MSDSDGGIFFFGMLVGDVEFDGVFIGYLWNSKIVMERFLWRRWCELLEMSCGVEVG